jgi:hypothetical protein
VHDSDQKILKKKYFRSYGRKTIIDQPLGQSCAKMNKLLPQFFPIFNTSKMQKKQLRKFSLESKSQLIENYWPF